MNTVSPASSQRVPRGPLHRLFFALVPPRAEANRIVNLQTWQGQHQRADRLHATLAITDDYAQRPDILVAAMRNAGDCVAASPFVVEFDQLSAGARSVVLRPGKRNPGLHAFQQTLAAAMAARGVRLRRGWKFHPHVTVSYRDGETFTRQIDPIRWPARDFVLIHSVVGRTQHFELGRWALNAAPASDLFGERPRYPFDIADHRSDDAQCQNV